MWSFVFETAIVNRNFQRTDIKMIDSRSARLFRIETDCVISLPSLISRFVGGSTPRICSRLVRKLKTAVRHNQLERCEQSALSVRQSLGAHAHLRGVRVSKLCAHHSVLCIVPRALFLGKNPGFKPDVETRRISHHAA